MYTAVVSAFEAETPNRKKKILLLPARKKHPYLLALANPPRARAHIKLGKFFSGGEKFLSAKKSKTCH